NNAVADDRKLALSNDPGWQQREFVSRAVDDQSVTGIVTTLKTDDDIGLLRQPVDDLAFAFVAPLGSDNHNIRHQDPFPAPAPGHLEPGATGQVHLRIKEASMGGKPKSAADTTAAGCNNSLILRLIFRNAGAWPAAPAAAHAPWRAPRRAGHRQSRSALLRCRPAHRVRHETSRY